MCGISLVLSSSEPDVKIAISKMVSVMNHRGPDGNGTYTHIISDSLCLALGHNRLSIIDLTESASQPMKSQDGRYVLIYNGEVYNYREIAQQLDRIDLPEGNFGDTAVVLASLIKWGPLALQKFNGMWALVLYDTREKTLLISRDRFGIKPLYYYQDGNSFYVASEVKAILVAAGLQFAINPRVAIPYLTRGLLNFSGDTFFEQVQQFPPASYQVIKLREGDKIGNEVHRFWYHPFEEGHVQTSGSVSAEEIRVLFLDSTKLRLRSDVPVGILLSGGIDSSSILGGIASTQSLDNLTVLSVISDDPASSEEPFIDAMARFVHCSPHKVNVSADPDLLLDNLSDACWFNDEPIGDISSLAHMNLMKIAARKGIKVLLTGQGADEQLGGYNKFFYFYLFSLLKEHKYGCALQIIAQFARNSNTLYEFRLSEAMRYVRKEKFAYGTFISPKHQHLDSIDIGFQGSYPKREWIDLKKTSVPALLHFEDRMSMSQSVEMRVPFLDYRLVELLARVHPSEKFDGGWTKSIFRRAIEGLVPKEIQYRRDKKGFNVPGNEWMKGALKERVMNLFSSELMAERMGFLDSRELNMRYSAFMNGRGYLNETQFFRAFAFETFLRRFKSYIDS